MHVTDYSNASRTMLFNINDLCWDKEILQELDIPESMLPTPVPSSQIYGYTDPSFLGDEIPIAGAAGDQQAALLDRPVSMQERQKHIRNRMFPFNEYRGKTGIFKKWSCDDHCMGTGRKSKLCSGRFDFRCRSGNPVASRQYEADRFLRRLRVHGKKSTRNPRLLCGSGIYRTGRTALGSVCERYDRWHHKRYQQNHIIRATLESIDLQVCDVIDAMRADAGVELKSLKVDGGASANNFLMQFQADMINAPVKRPSCIETTAMGAAYLAGLAVGYWKSKEDVIKNQSIDQIFSPQMSEEDRQAKRKGWNKAVKYAYGWAKDEPEEEEE